MRKHYGLGIMFFVTLAYLTISVAHAGLQFIEQIHPRTISVDGDPSDWQGIEPWFTDPRGDSFCEAGTDFKAVYLARDGNYIYWRMDTWDGKFSSGDANLFKHPMIHFYVTDPEKLSYGVKWQRMQDPDIYGYGVVMVNNQPGGEWIYKHQGIEYGVIGIVAEGKIPLSTLAPFTINNVMVFYYAGYPNVACDIASWTYDGQINISGYWDEYVPVIQSDKVDIKYFRQVGNVVIGKSSLGSDINGSISGSKINLSFSDLAECSEYSGTISDQLISGVCTSGTQTGTEVNFRRSTFHFVNFVPGDVFDTPTPTFAWTRVKNADSYQIDISKDNANGDCSETSSCVYMWGKYPVISTETRYNLDGAASSSLQSDILYRIKVRAVRAASEIDNTFDVRFQVTNSRPPGMPWIPLLLLE